MVGNSRGVQEYTRQPHAIRTKTTNQQAKSEIAVNILAILLWQAALNTPVMRQEETEDVETIMKRRMERE
jgi:hypothetical protein